jgi:hypothetical protein
VLPTIPPPIDRPVLLAAVAQATEAFALGQAYPQAAAGLAGRRFEISLPFGCHGASSATAALRFDWNAGGRKIKLIATPQDWSQNAVVRQLVGTPETEAIEGFWLSRPWIPTADCPAQAASAKAPVSPETVGLVELFEKGGSRLLRRSGRPYEVTRKLANGETPPDVGYRLILSGRIPDSDPQPIRCTSAGPDQRPTCFVRVELDRVSLESGAGASIADWTS